ncbi:MAG: 30S ribosomal protein S4 [Candidatus Baldrarchaeia archaeon]
MGDPRRPKNKYISPRHPWRRELLQEELILVGKYGLRNKKELRRHLYMLRKIRHRARELLAMPEEQRKEAENQFIKKLQKMGFLPEGATLDDVLSMTVENILERRLQTIVYKKGLAKSPHHARQLVVHGHIAINGRRVTCPSYLVPVDEEDLIWYAPSSPYNDPNHPERPKSLKEVSQSEQQ